MTLDEAIKHAEEVAEENQRVVDTGIVFEDVTIDMLFCDDTEVINEHLANYQSCANEHRQLAEWLKDYKRLLEQEPCEDAISRQAVEEITWEEPSYTDPLNVLTEIREKIRALPSVTPQYTDAEIQKMQELEQAEIQKAYELGKAEQPKLGRWIIKDGKEKGYDIGGVKTWYIQMMCDKCGFIKTAIEERTGQYKFCPNCGAKMESEVEDADSD